MSPSEASSVESTTDAGNDRERIRLTQFSHGAG